MDKFSTYSYVKKTLFCIILPLFSHSYIVNDNVRPKFSSKSILYSSPLDISTYKAKELKQILQASNINTKSLYDKKELEDALSKELIKWDDKYKSTIVSIPLHIIQYGSPPKDYTAIDVTINNAKLKFIIDTGSSINIIKTTVFNNLQINYNRDNSNIPNKEPIYTQGVGGGGAVSGGTLSAGGGNTLKVIPLQLGNVPYTLPFILLDNLQFFPTNVAGILGIDFLENIGSRNQAAINLNYEQSLFQYGPINAFLSPLKKWNTKKICLKRISPNLLTCDVYITSQNTQITVGCTGLIDLGSAATIVNIPTITALKEDPLKLEVSPLTCVGVDNRPMRMKNLRISQYTIGDIAADVGDSRNKRISTDESSDGNNQQQQPMQVLVADIPALKTVGLSDKPAMILGQDLLQRAFWPSAASQSSNISQQKKTSHSGQIKLDLTKNHLYIPQ